VEHKATTQKANFDFRQRSINRKYRREESVAIWSKRESLYEAMPNEGGKRAINTASIQQRDAIQAQNPIKPTHAKNKQVRLLTQNS